MLTKILKRKKTVIAAILLLAAALLLTPPRQSWKSGETTVTLSGDRTTYKISGKGAMEDYEIPGWWGGAPPYIWTKTPVVSSIVSLIFGYAYRFEVMDINIENEVISRFPGLVSVLTESTVTDLVIGKGVTHIGNWAFYQFDRLTSLTIPGNVESIGFCAFAQCDNLTSVTFEEGVKSINGFLGCTRLTSVTIPNSVDTIESLSRRYGAFFGCTGLTSVTVAADNPRYSSEDGVVFDKNKTALLWYPQGRQGAYTIPSGVIIIKDGAFSGENVDYFHEGMLESSGRTRLTSITIPGSVASIEGAAFDDCVNLTSIAVAADNARYSSEDGILFNKDKTVLIRYPPSRQDTAYTIPNGVTSIGDRAFYSCGNLTSVTIPNSVTSIDEYAFSHCVKPVSAAAIK